MPWRISTGYEQVKTNGKLWATQSAFKPWSFWQSANKFRFEVHALDTASVDTVGRERSELSAYGWTLPFNTDIHFSHWMMIELGEFHTSPFVVLGQAHATEDAGDIGASPPFAFELSQFDELKVSTRTSTADPLVTNPPPTIRYQQPISRGAWHKLRGILNFNTAGSGKCQIWLNNNQIVDAQNISMGYVDAVGPYWKWGIYRGAGDVNPIAVQYSGVEIGTASLAGRDSAPVVIP